MSAKSPHECVIVAPGHCIPEDLRIGKLKWKEIEKSSFFVSDTTLIEGPATCHILPRRQCGYDSGYLSASEEGIFKMDWGIRGDGRCWCCCMRYRSHSIDRLRELFNKGNQEKLTIFRSNLEYCGSTILFVIETQEYFWLSNETRYNLGVDVLTPVCMDERGQLCMDERGQLIGNT